MSDKNQKSLPNAFNLNKFDNIEELVKKAAREIIKLSQESINARGEFNICLSGGNTPKKLFSELVEIHKSDNNLINWEKFNFFWGDERYVPKTDEQSNFKMTKDFLFSKLENQGVKISESQIFALPTEEVNANITADAYEQELRQKFNGKMPQFDLLLLGMGPDGHCASLFPHTKVTQTYARGEQKKKLGKLDQMVAANWVEKFDMFRVTLTPPIINHAKEIIFLIAGQEKADSLKEVLEGQYNPEEYPSQMIHPENGNLNFYIDKAAAQKI